MNIVVVVVVVVVVFCCLSLNKYENKTKCNLYFIM